MEGYSNILIAIDLRDDAEQILKKAIRTLKSGGTVKLIYVMENFTSMYYGAAIYTPVLIDSQDLETKTIEINKEHLASIGQKLNIAAKNLVFVQGKPAVEIKQYAQDNQCDLIVVGSHGKHGLGLLLGSTANAVLHGAPCDVLAIKVNS